jgi:hypothetical protein
MDMEPTGQKPRLGRVLLAAIVLVWCAFVVTVYYVSHKPANTRQLDALGRLGLTLIAWVGTLALAHGLAVRIAPSMESFPALPRLALRLGLGLGMISLVTLGLGAVGGLWRVVPWVAVIATVPFTIRGLWSDLLRTAVHPVPRGPTRLLALFVGLTMLLAVIPAFAPPTAWDALVYHLTGPKLYIAAHRLVQNVDIPHLGFPQAGEMLFTWGMLLAGPELAQVFHATFAGLTLLLLGSITEIYAPGRGWLAAALLAAVPSAVLVAGWAYVEWMTMFAGLACLTLLVWATEGQTGGISESTARAAQESSRWSHPPSAPLGNAGLWGLAGFFAAQAVSTKYTAIGVVGGLSVYAAWRLRPWRGVAVFAGTAALFTFPYLLKNALLTGNPLYPFFFSGVFWDSLRQGFFSRPGTGLGPTGLLVAPWEATVWGVEGGVVTGHPSYGATLGPLFLVFIPLILLRLRQPQGRRAWFHAFLLASGTMYVLWLIGLASSHLLLQSRLLFPALPMFVGLAVFGFDSLERIGWPGFSLRYVVGALVTLVLALTLVSTVLSFVTDSPLGVVAGSESQASYNESRLGIYSWVMDRINLLPDGSRVVFLWEPRSYPCSSNIICEPDDITDRWWHLRRLGMTASEIAAQWRSEGVTHILYYEYGAQLIRDAEVDPYLDSDWTQLDRLIDADLEEVERWGDVYVLYRLR